MITTENYREIYEELVEDTSDFTSESGVIKCTTKKASDIIREILSNYYNIIDYGISDIEDVENNVYMVIYNDRNDSEELSFEEEPFEEPEEVEEVPDDIEVPEEEEVQESLSLVENYLTEGVEESKIFVSDALKQHQELRELIKEGAWKELEKEVYKLCQTDYYEDIKHESAWGKFLEVFDKSGVNYSIEEIPEYCFRNSDITSFRIPEGTKRIRMCAFDHCTNLTSITIPDSVEDIDNSAFWSCVSLTEIKLPASLRIIGIDTFRNCKNWQGDVVVPDGCHAVMDRAFMKCASLKSVTLPKGTTVGPDCFKDCNLEKLVLPDNKYKYNPWAKKIGISGMLKRKIFIAEDLNKSLVEKIVKKGSQWQVQSEKGRNMGTYSTKKEAEERLRQVEYFKHKNESIDDGFKLHHSLKEDIPTFWEWVDEQGLDPDVVEENPDLEEYFRQQYDITFNLKSPEDYDLSDIDVPDDYDDFDLYQQEEELPGYHYVCYFDDDDKDEADSGNAETLEKAIEVCDNLRASKGYDCAEIFGPNGSTVATFWEGKWNTDYNESLTEDNNTKKFEIRKEYIDDVLENNGNAPIDAILNPDYYYVNIIDVGDKYILEGDETNVYNMLVPFDLQWRIYPLDESLTEAKKKVVATITYTYDGSDRAYSDDDDAYKYWCEEIECHPASFKKKGIDKGDKFTADIVQYGDDEDDIGIINIKKVTNESLVDDKLKFSPNYNPAGTPIGRGTGLGEELDDEEPSLECLNCGCDTEWLGTQGDLEEFKCPECGEYYYLTKDGRVVGEEAFRKSLEDDEENNYWNYIEDDFRKGLETLPKKKEESLNEAIVNGAFTPETFSKALRNTELISDLDDEEFSDKLADIFTDELTRMRSPELQNWEDGYYDDYDEVYKLLDNEGRKTVTNFIANNLKIKGKGFTKKEILNVIQRAVWDSNRIGKAFGSDSIEHDINGNNIYVLVIADGDDSTIKVYIGNNTTREDPIEYTFNSVERASNQARALADSANKAAGIIEESLTEASGKKYKVTGTLRNIWYDDNGDEVDREEWEETHTYTIDSDNLSPEDLAKVKFEDGVTKYWNKRVRHDDGSEFEVEVTSVEPLNESLTEALIHRDMDTIKKSDLSKAPMGSVLKLKFNERPNNNWIDAYVKLDTDDWAVLDDAGEIDGDYNLLDSQRLYFSLMDLDEMTEFEIDTAPNKKYNFNLTEAVIDFYNNNIKKQYSRFCDIYERAFEKIPDLKIKVINRSYVAEKTINSSDASASIGILGGDSDGTFFELRLDPEASDSFATYYIDKDGNVSVESTIYGNTVELCHLFDKKKDRIIDLITPLFDAAYDKLSEAIKNAGFKLGESLTEAKNDTLNPDIWDENKELKPEVKEKLELIVDKFKERLKEDGVDIDIDDIIIVGSNANYNYTDKSDIDLHLVADLSIYKDKEDLAQVVYNAYRRLFNDKFDPMIYGHEVELYIEPKE